MSGTATSNTSDGDSTTSGNTIQLDQMSLDQLDQLKQREETRMQALGGRYGQLRQAAARLSASQMAVKELQESLRVAESKGRTTCDVFVPLTESVYVPGTIPLVENIVDDDETSGTNQKSLLVELGTGYFVEKSPDETVEYVNRKLRLVDANSNNVTSALQSTKHNIEQITMAMQGKLLEIRARQEGQRHRSAAEG